MSPKEIRLAVVGTGVWAQKIHYPTIDYLRAHPKSALSVELIKRQIARHHADDIEAYYDIKDPVYDLIWDAAQAWAQQTGWAPG